MCDQGILLFREIDARDPAFFDLTGLFQVYFILIDKCEHIPADSNGIFMVQLLPADFFFVNERSIRATKIFEKIAGFSCIAGFADDLRMFIADCKIIDLYLVV